MKEFIIGNRLVKRLLSLFKREMKVVWVEWLFMEMYGFKLFLEMFRSLEVDELVLWYEDKREIKDNFLILVWVIWSRSRVGVREETIEFYFGRVKFEIFV